jgi:hypothetical protein
MEYISDLNTTAEIEAYLCKRTGMSPQQASAFVDKVRATDVPNVDYDLAAGASSDLVSKNAELVTIH